ncbi:hypothetical protein GKR57_17485 [Providencia stuartii]|uniref:Uncharacterized protein n=1 Tax=Providencia stuartii ATCC 25827 TaxID=471874 RepID=A0AA87CRK6_PROST|nr:hypothetical protein [Providencia stuartii]EDU60046.1 hypothetical protein PROSTU_03250 [Providencia stuartii ATCC 25827]MDE5306947.1 hypothetical protein [Providencia stuartii]MTC20929.1 hypothetical protein [Providencia stuartii]
MTLNYLTINMDDVPYYLSLHDKPIISILKRSLVAQLTHDKSFSEK